MTFGMQDLHTQDTIDGWTTNRNVVRFQLEPDAVLPVRNSAGAAGYDLCLRDEITVVKNRLVMADTGVRVASPVPMLLMARSSLVKRGIILANSVGLIDPDYRGTIKIPLVYLDFQDMESGDRFEIPGRTAIAQLVFISAYLPSPVEVEALDKTERGDGGFGSTNRKCRKYSQNCTGTAVYSGGLCDPCWTAAHEDRTNTPG